MEEINDIKKRHKGDFITLFRILNIDFRLLKSTQMWSAIIMTVICSHVIFYCCDSDSLISFLSQLIGRVLSIIPNVLGFTLTGYVLIVGIGWDKFLETITDQDDDGYSLFQQISSVFAWGIIIQSICLISTYFVSLIYDLHVYSNYANCVNGIVLVLIMFLSFYSLFLILKLIINVFHYGQLVQYYFTEKRLIKKIQEGNKNSK